MSMPKSAALEQQAENKYAEVRALFDKADTEYGGDDAAIKDQVIALTKEAEEFSQRAAEAREMEGLRAKADGRQELIEAARSGMRFPEAQNDGKGLSRGAVAKEIKSLSDQFLESPEFKNYMGQFGDHIPNGTHVQTPPVPVKGLGLKTLVTGASGSTANIFIVNEQSGIYDPLGRRDLMLRDLISIRQTGSDVIEYVRQLTRENAAAFVAEATATSGGSGVKPEGGFTFERASTTVRTLAEWVAATKRSLSDAGQMRGIIEQELRDDLAYAVDDAIINGSGVGENLEGLDAVSGTQDQAWDTDLLTTTRKARTLVKTVGRAVPTAYVLNPLDWQRLDLLEDNEARYYFGGPMQMGTPRLWGLPVVESEAVPSGWGWVGEWRRIVMWDREQASITVSDSHSDFFIRNMVAILAELRVAMAVIRPSAFVEMDLTA